MNDPYWEVRVNGHLVEKVKAWRANSALMFTVVVDGNSPLRSLRTGQRVTVTAIGGWWFRGLVQNVEVI